MLGALLRPHLGQRLDAVASAASMEVAPAFTRLAEYAMQPDATRPAAAQVLMKPLLTARELLTLREWAQRIRRSIFGSMAAVGSYARLNEVMLTGCVCPVLQSTMPEWRSATLRQAPTSAACCATWGAAL